MTDFDILKRLYKSYTRRFIKKIFLAVILSIILAASTSSIAWLLDPAIKKIFIEKDENLILLIPGFIILAFATKGFSLYAAKIIMIGVAEDVKKLVQVDMMNSLIIADTQFIEKKHSGKFITNLTNDVGFITNLVRNGKSAPKPEKRDSNWGITKIIKIIVMIIATTTTAIG